MFNFKKKDITVRVDKAYCNVIKAIINRMNIYGNIRINSVNDKVYLTFVTRTTTKRVCKLIKENLHKAHTIILDDLIMVKID